MVDFQSRDAHRGTVPSGEDDTEDGTDEEEIAGLLWVDYEHLHKHPAWYRQLRLCPWFEIAMRRDFS